MVFGRFGLSTRGEEVFIDEFGQDSFEGSQTHGLSQTLVEP